MKVKLTAFLLAVLLLGTAFYVFNACRSRREAGPGVSPGSKEALLFFASTDGSTYAQRTARLPANAPDLPGRIRGLLAAMTAKPAEPSSPTLWPVSLSMRSAYLMKNGILILDLDPIRPYNQIPGAAGELRIVRSLVRTLTAYFENVRSVKFLVNGFEQETLAGHVDITRPLGNEDLEP